MSDIDPVVYEQCGLRLRSEVQLHLPPSTGERYDVDIRWGEEVVDTSSPPPGDVIAACGTGDTTWYTATSSDSGYRIRFRDCGEFLVSRDLAAVEVRSDPTGRVELLPILLAGTVTAFLLTLRGKTVLHASAVAVGGSALAFIGQSGRGKSTVATLLCLDGAALVADDILAVDSIGPVACIGGSPEIRVRPAAAPLVDSRTASSTRITADQRVAYSPPATTRESVPMAAIVVPSPSRQAESVEIQLLSSSQALVALLSFPRVSGWSEPDVLSRDFVALGQIADRVPAYGARIPWGPPFDPTIARTLAGLVSR